MRLIRAEIKNFKLLKDVSLYFSTDSDRPLTVIRAENGSGKTSILYALIWGFYGMSGLPASARDKRLTSSWMPAGETVNIRVMIELEHVDDLHGVNRYRLIRSVTEIASEGDKVERHSEDVTVFRITPAGEEIVEHGDALIAKLVPLRLKDVFFTNGDDVQEFISGEVATRQRQQQVNHSIRALLSLEELRMASKDLEAVTKKLRADSAKDAGTNISSLEAALEKTESEIGLTDQKLAELGDQLSNMVSQKTSWEKELSALRGHGDLEDLNQRIASETSEQAKLELSEKKTLSRMRELLKSESCSWAMLGEQLQVGHALLSDLADRNVIPGASVEVLKDRLILGTCICGEKLKEGTSLWNHVQDLIDEQTHVSESLRKLTSLYHQARQSMASEEATEAEERTFARQREALLKELVDTRTLLESKGNSLRHLKERRALIDESRVQDLTKKLSNVEAKIANTNQEIGELTGRQKTLNGVKDHQETQLRDAEKASKINSALLARRNISEDAYKLCLDILKVFEVDYVRRVSDRMNEIFMRVTGSQQEAEGAAFTGVHIDEKFNIVVDTHNGRSLDPDFELNGAAQRQLTLSFIWALMEISGVSAPRIIDTPLGMMSGGDKSRLVAEITRQASADTPEFQVILLLTRSEVRDIEGLLDERAGIVQTLSCSRQYPEDLVYSWGVDRPVSRICSCNHRQSCLICARKYDAMHGVTFRNIEASI